MTKSKQAIDIRAAAAEAGIELSERPVALASYVPAQRSGNLVFVSGQVPLDGGTPLATGRVPSEVSEEDCRALAARCAEQAIGALLSVLAEGEGLVQVVRLGGFVACDASFGGQPAIINGASDLMQRVFGAQGVHARAAVGVSSLPLNVPVEIEFLFEVGPLG